MPLAARYVHTNLIARDWRRLARFYQEVFGCVPVPPERHLREAWLERATAIPGAEAHGIHLRLPGRGDGGPTIEIFQYGPDAVEHGDGAEGRCNDDSSTGAAPVPKPVDGPGFAHVAFAVDDVAAAVDAVRAAGGGLVGEIVSVTVAGAGALVFAYTTDPEGNVIELQRWAG